MSITRMPESRLKSESLPAENRWQALHHLFVAKEELREIQSLVNALEFALEGACGSSVATSLSSVTRCLSERLKSTAESLSDADVHLRV